MKLPEKIKIGRHIYTIEEVPNLKDDDIELLGQADYGKSRIQIEQHQSDTSKLHVLTHEIIHTIMGQSTLGWRQDQEDICVSLTVPFVDFICDNPHLIRFMQKEFAKHDSIAIAAPKAARKPRTTAGKSNTGSSVDNPPSPPERKPRTKSGSTRSK